ncbi:type VI secretion protein [Streptomyces sp. NPDC050560]|uniref:type VI secretion protein n=1 Tax=Streptomyces sp. NPDC050560 TaxID=3365630 RepID=UPI0037A80612
MRDRKRDQGRRRRPQPAPGPGHGNGPEHGQAYEHDPRGAGAPGIPDDHYERDDRYGRREGRYEHEGPHGRYEQDGRDGYYDPDAPDGLDAPDDPDDWYDEPPRRPVPRPRARRPGPEPEAPRRGGVPDGLLVGFLAFLLGITALIWTATGLAGLFAHGSWPKGVTFAHTPAAVRQLIGSPHDLAGAWPDTPPTQLSGYGLMWGLLIGQVMVALVLALFVMGTVTRWRAVRQRARRARQRPAPAARRRDPYERRPAPRKPARPTAPRPHGGHQAPPETPLRAKSEAAPRPTPEPPPPTAPAPSDPVPVEAAPAAPVASPAPPRGTVLGPVEVRRPAALRAVRDAEGPALVITSDTALWEETKDARAKLGPVLLYDPTHLCETPARMHWSPTAGCQDRTAAGARAVALLAPVRPSAKIDAAVVDTAHTLLRCFLHAAAVDGRQLRHVHRWAQGKGVQDAVRVLRTHAKAAPGAAGELEGALTAHPERRDIAQQLIARALSALGSVHIRDSCTPSRSDAAALDSLVAEGGTLYVVGEAIEEPKSRPEAMPLLTALAASVVEHGRSMAERSSAGRLDPPLSLVLDDVAAVAPLPQLPALLASGAEQGLPTLALLRSREQARSRWPDWPTDQLPT